MATNKAGSSLYSYTVAPHLAEEFDVPISDFAIAHPQHTYYVLGAFIFTNRVPASSASHHARDGHLSQFKSNSARPESQPLMLIIQRALNDSWGGYWDFPGGSLEASDQTLLDGVAREVFEETGFHVRKIRDLVRVDAWTVHKRGSDHRVAKFTFVVDVHESADTLDWEEKVRLSPEEHMKWLWVTGEEIRESARVMKQARENNPGRPKETAPYTFVGIQGETAWEGFKTYLRLLGREDVSAAGDDAAKV
jgi:8-oxo-dGTP pyrophosphatase MutT (NUDIX family)